MVRFLVYSGLPLVGFNFHVTNPAIHTSKKYTFSVPNTYTLAEFSAQLFFLVSKKGIVGAISYVHKWGGIGTS